MSAGSGKTLYLFRVSPVIEEWIRRRKGPYRVCRWVSTEDKEGESSFVKDCLFLVPFEEMGSFQKVHLSVPFITFGKVEYISRAFKAGAVEHLSFPFNPKEFDSRLAHAFNELEKLQKEPPSHSPVWLDRCFLIGPAGKVYLNPFEVMIMTHFLHSPSQVLVRGHVHKELSDGRYRQNRIVDVYISRLRKKIALVCLSQGQVTIRSVRGTGYQLEYQEPRAEEKL